MGNKGAASGKSSGGGARTTSEFSEETKQKARELLERHTVDDKSANEEIADHIAKQDEIGQYFTAKMAEEEQSWKEKIEKQKSDIEKSYKEQIEDLRQGQKFGYIPYTDEQLKDMNMFPKKETFIEPKFYRKGSMNGRTLAFSTNQSGAGMSFLTQGESGYIGHDHSFTLGELRAKGYRPIAGIKKMDVGMVGESEVLFVKTSRGKK